MAGSIYKLDAVTKSFVQGWEDPECYATEPVFVPRPDSVKEDDGVIVTSCLNPDKKSPSTSMVVLNSDMEELGRISVPYSSPVSFHGVWVDHTANWSLMEDFDCPEIVS